MIQPIHALIDASETEPHRFPPTLLHNEVWMLRLVLYWFNTHEMQGHPLSFQAGATWFSEALLPSPFRARHRGDRRAEARTHANGVIGDFEVGTSGKADIHLKPDANQFVVIEAKIHSLLPAGTRIAPGYDQAARSVAYIAEVLSRADQHPSEIESLAFIVTAPQADIDRNQIAAKLEKSSIEAAVRSRAGLLAGTRCLARTVVPANAGTNHHCVVVLGEPHQRHPGPRRLRWPGLRHLLREVPGVQLDRTGAGCESERVEQL